MNIVFDLIDLTKVFETQTHAHLKDLNRSKVSRLNSKDRTYDEIITLLKSTLNKKPYKGKTYCANAVSIINEIVDTFQATPVENKQSDDEETQSIKSGKQKRKIGQNDEENQSNKSGKQKRKISQKKSKRSKKHKRSSSQSSHSSTGSSSSNSSSSDDSSDDSGDESDFTDLFEVRRRGPVIVSQEFQCLKKNKRVKLISPGEQGSHLVKIEITKTKDLQSCASSKFYWQKVARKGLFLLDVSDKNDEEVYSTLNDILKTFGKKIKKIDNTKTVSYDLTKDKK